MTSLIEWITRADFSVLYRIQALFRCRFLDVLMPVVTFLGNAGWIWLLTAALLLLTKKYRRTAWVLFAGLAIGLLIGNLALKPLVARPRPCWLDPTIALLIKVPRDYAFPSGHTLSSVIAATVLTAANHRFGMAAIPLAALIACSRLYLFVHYPTDVLASIVLGILIGLAVWRTGQQFAKKHPPKKQI